MQFDDFWRANYRRMVGYCCTVWANEADVEEVVADVIYKHFDAYLAKIEDGPGKFNTMRRWMNRRVLLDLKTRYFKLSNRMEESGHETEKMGDTMSEDEAPEETLHWDTPEEICSLAQRLPPVHPILIEYDPVRGGPWKAGTRLVPNTQADISKFCRERKKFLAALSA
jgi:hypothetical protein